MRKLILDMTNVNVSLLARLDFVYFDREKLSFDKFGYENRSKKFFSLEFRAADCYNFW